MATVGTDGVAPLYAPDDVWKMWNIDEIWQGINSVGRNRYVPKVNDYVVRPSTFETWIVDELDPVTLKPTLRTIRPAGMNYDLTEDDILFGVGPGPDSQTYRAYVNTTVSPHTLQVEARLYINGSQSSYAKIFMGSDTSESGEVISKVYDASGNFVSVNVPLELVEEDSHTNYFKKCVRRCFTTKPLKSGEVVTVVCYADDGHVVSRRQLLVEITDTIQDLSSSLKYITDIGLESIWLSKTVPNQLNYPLNITLDAFNMLGVVTYSDGTKLKLPVNGNKFSMFGLDSLVPSIIGQNEDLVLRYALSQGEVAYSAAGANGKYITKPYKIKVIDPNNSIAVKLFGYPFWDSASQSYRIRWWLTNLARNVVYEVTPFVHFSDDTGPFEPSLYDYLQRKRVYINLRDVSGAFIPYNHVQVVDFVLDGSPSQNTVADWTVGTDAGATRFGNNVYGVKSGAQVNFGAGHSTLEEWLNDYYFNTRPLVNTLTEVAAPTPTHFIVNYNGTVTEWSVSNWNTDLAIAANVVTPATVSIRFIKRTSSGDLQLAVAAAPIKPGI